MKNPLFVRALTPEEQNALEEALASTVSFTLRRAQILRLSSQQRRPQQIAENLGCAVQTVRNAIHAFHEGRLDALEPQAPGPKNPERIFDPDTSQELLEIAHRSPRDFGKVRSTWSLVTLAEVAFDEGLTQEQVSIETIRQAILALGSSWKRAKNWITSPDPQYALKKSNVTA